MAAFSPTRIGMIIAGLEVPHCHLHLIPIDSEADLSFAQADHDPDPDALDEAAERLRAALRDDGHGDVVPPPDPSAPRPGPADAGTHGPAPGRPSAAHRQTLGRRQPPSPAEPATMIWSAGISAASSAPLLRTLLTSVDTGRSSVIDAGAGTSSFPSVSMSSLSGSSHSSHAEGGRITGIRSWICAIVSLGVVVMIVHDRSGSPCGCPRRPWAPPPSHRPAKANGSPSGRWMKYGCLRLAPGTFLHS